MPTGLAACLRILSDSHRSHDLAHAETDHHGDGSIRADFVMGVPPVGVLLQPGRRIGATEHPAKRELLSTEQTGKLLEQMHSLSRTVEKGVDQAGLSLLGPMQRLRRRAARCSLGRVFERATLVTSVFGGWLPGHAASRRPAYRHSVVSAAYRAPVLYRASALCMAEPLSALKSPS